MTWVDMVQGLVRALAKLVPDKRIHVNDDHLLGAGRWIVDVHSVGNFEGEFASDILAQVRAKLGLEEVSAEDLAQELEDEATKGAAAQLRGRLGPARTQPPALSPQAPAPAAPAVDLNQLADLVVQKMAAAASSTAK